MRYLLLATDFDGTLARDGIVTQETIAALEKLRATGRKLILVTGRELNELLHIFPGVHLFEKIVAENGALIYESRTRAVRILAERPPPAFIEALQRRNVSPISVGRVIVATWRPQETAVLETIRDMGLDLQVIFNKDAVMVLPSSVNKATGLAAALKELELSPHEVVSVGDAENDHAMLAMSECGVAVRNALPTLKDHADLVTHADHGRGVEQLIDNLLEDDLKAVQERSDRHALVLGPSDTGKEGRLPSYGSSLLIAGAADSAKSTVGKNFLAKLQEQRYQFCIIDPRGEFESLNGTVMIGNSKRAPTVEEILQLLKPPEPSVVVNLVGLLPADLSSFFMGLWPRLLETRGRTGRPHWIVVDEADRVLPADWQSPGRLDRIAFITVHPEKITAALKSVGTVLTVGRLGIDEITHARRFDRMKKPAY